MPTISQPGDRVGLSARFRNRQLKAFSFVEQLQRTESFDPSRLNSSAGIVRIHNGSGGDVVQGGVLAINDVFPRPADNLEAFKSNFIFEGVTPVGGDTDGDRAGKFVVTLEPILDGAIGRACGSGVCPAKVNFEAPGDWWADIWHNDTRGLYSSMGGHAQVLWRASYQGLVWALVRIGTPRGVALGSTFQILAGGKSHASMTVSTPPEDMGVSSRNMTSYDWLLQPNHALNEHGIKIKLIGDRWYITAAEWYGAGLPP